MTGGQLTIGAKDRGAKDRGANDRGAKDRGANDPDPGAYDRLVHTQIVLDHFRQRGFCFYDCAQHGSGVREGREYFKLPVGIMK